jgi:hypothetical protein
MRDFKKDWKDLKELVVDFCVFITAIVVGIPTLIGAAVVFIGSIALALAIPVLIVGAIGGAILAIAVCVMHLLQAIF